MARASVHTRDAEPGRASTGENPEPTAKMKFAPKTRAGWSGAPTFADLLDHPAPTPEYPRKGRIESSRHGAGAVRGMAGFPA